MADDLIRRKDALNFELTVEGPREAKEAILRTSQGIMDYIKSLPAVGETALRDIGEWDMFNLISSVYFGKQMYFLQESGVVYSRHTCRYITRHDALSEFLGLIGEW